MEGGLDPEYVLDKMQQYEIKPLVKYLHLKNKESWEQTRLLGYITAQGNSTKKLKPTDIIKFPWDEQGKESDTSVKSADIERLKKKANEFKQYI